MQLEVHGLSKPDLRHLGRSMLRSLSQRACTSIRAAHIAQFSRPYNVMAAAASAQPGIFALLRVLCACLVLVLAVAARCTTLKM